VVGRRRWISPTRGSDRGRQGRAHLWVESYPSSEPERLSNFVLGAQSPARYLARLSRLLEGRIENRGLSHSWDGEVMFAVGLVVEGLEMDCGAFALEITRGGPLSTPALFSVALWALPPATAAFGGSMIILETTEAHVRFFPRRHSKRGSQLSEIRRRQQGTLDQHQPSLMPNIITFARQFYKVPHTCRYLHKHLAGRQSITAPMLHPVSPPISGAPPLGLQPRTTCATWALCPRPTPR
jgi:hypothetical protein